MKKQEVVDKIIRSLVSGGLKTGVGCFSVEKNEVRVVQFKNEAEYQKLLKIRSFVPSTDGELLSYVNQSIPIIEDIDLSTPLEPIVEIPFPIDETFTNIPSEEEFFPVVNEQLKPSRRRGLV